MAVSRTGTALLGLAVRAVLTIGISLIFDVPILLVSLPFIPLVG